MGSFPEYLVRLKLGREALTLDINPSKIAGKMRDARLRRIWLAAQRNPFLSAFARASITRCARAARPFNFSDAAVDLVSFESGSTYQLMSDIWANRHALEKSETYGKISAQVAATGAYTHKNYQITDRAEIIPLIETCFLDLLNSMAKDGYLRHKKSSYGTGGIGKAVVWHDGSIRHENGATHRLAAARIAGMTSPFPLRIVGVHREWLKAHDVRKLSQVSKLPELFKSIDAVI